jgi:predicted 3-demethylubiquinone-9 3-methyltransferase (glyoxalase superfamily)/uncharacterized protein YndB with AHSA1/START domain
MEKPLYPCLWFNGNAKEAATFYCTIFKNSKITAENPLVVCWELNGSPFMGLNGGPQFQFNEAVSFVIECKTQEEIDHYWNHLIADGGSEGQCGWCKDKYGVSWQVVPQILSTLMADPEQREAVMAAFMKMKKFDLPTLLQAAPKTNTFDVQIDAPLARVWEALTHTETAQAWMKNVQVKTDWQQGSAITYTCYDAAGKVMQWEGTDMIWRGTIETFEVQKELTCVYPDGETGLLRESYLLQQSGDGKTQLRQVQTLTTAAVAASYKEGTLHSLDLLKNYLEGSNA